jgi:hypothetical protein
MRLTVILDEDEQRALAILAQKERRNPKAQAAIEIRRALENAGFLAPTAGNKSQAEASA